MSFVKLDESTLDSSVWASAEQAAIWVACLLMARPVTYQKPRRVFDLDTGADAGWDIPPGTYGLIEAASSGILNRARVQPDRRDVGMAALRSFCSPDPESKTRDHHGRRLARVDGGFLVINFAKYRDKDHTNADRQRRFRDRAKENGDLGAVTGDVTQAEAYGYIEGGGQAKKAARLPRDFQLPNDWRLEAHGIATRKGVRIDVDDQFERFRDYWCGKSGADAAKLDWLATWRNWIRNSCDRAGRPIGSAGPRAPAAAPADAAFAEVRRAVTEGQSPANWSSPHTAAALVAIGGFGQLKFADSKDLEFRWKREFCDAFARVAHQ